ncbi:uncharacterized protein F4807DRAFT_466539 [Annulohypoxylon truncatum]|uniref:uncharacterized protein n=1 Tax=Annulohypoxylon truncatum TaxID=327061 RepID=UPI0020083E4B|nr:uncharacterized protein F4807DRAFT_466539 [Annulohypoxylon truncatum]KAI1211221.1 hypothetical protein F4807DRAFT_466539 [Annulohypoxylon truncatum]
MALNLLEILIILTLLPFSGLGKNVAPPVVKRRHAHPVPQNLHPNKAPSIKVTGQASHGQKQTDSKPEEAAPVPYIPQDHVFYDSYQANFSWSDPALQAALGIRPIPSQMNTRDGNIFKRSPGSTPDDPIFKLPSCLGCYEASQGRTVTLADLTTEYLEQQILLPDSLLQDRCVFYTSVPDPRKDPLSTADRAEFFNRVALGGEDRHHGLSLIATKWACSNNKVTIWNMYSGENDVSGGRDIPSKRNYWEVHVKGSWLNFLDGTDARFTYFENMSRAMARHCGGTIYVMSMRPMQLYKYKFIWGNVEYPQLLARYSAGKGGAPTKLISIDAANPYLQYVLDWTTQKPLDPLPPRDPDFLEVSESMLQARDTCTDNVEYEEPGEDWFG